jgi:hypothetical protein
MARHEADLEYGPTPPDAQHEHSDIEPSIAWKFAIWLAVGIVISGVIVYATFWFFEAKEESVDQANITYPLAAGQVKEPPTPRLQTQPFKDLYLLREHETEQLTGYGWVDKGAGVVRLPIDRAMERLLEQGLPVREQGKTDRVDEVVEDSSAGRTMAPR